MRFGDPAQTLTPNPFSLDAIYKTAGNEQQHGNRIGGIGFHHSRYTAQLICFFPHELCLSPEQTHPVRTSDFHQWHEQVTQDLCCSHDRWSGEQLLLDWSQKKLFNCEHHLWNNTCQIKKDWSYNDSQKLSLVFLLSFIVCVEAATVGGRSSFLYSRRGASNNPHTRPSAPSSKHAPSGFV